MEKTVFELSGGDILEVSSVMGIRHRLQITLFKINDEIKAEGAISCW